MNVITFTNVVISKGYEDNPAIRITNSENGSNAFFRVGEKIYDKRAQDNTRWNNWNVKAFGYLAERIQKMKLDAGSYVNLTGRIDMDTWDDNGARKSAPSIILDQIEFCHSNGNGKNNGSGTGDSVPAQQNAQGQPMPQQQQASGAPPTQPQARQTKIPENFTGYEQFGGGTNPFFPQG